MNNLELKITALREALRERVSELVDNYENKIADLRIEITLLSQENSELKAKLASASGPTEQKDIGPALQGQLVP